MFVVSSIKDGMNLMAKEYLYVKGEDGGVLILSSRAGASIELRDAWIIDPYNTEQIAETIERGMKEDSHTTIERNRRMLTALQEWTAPRWARNFVAAMSSAAAQRAGTSNIRRPQ
jgi:trehalose-6-phosphate synthase